MPWWSPQITRSRLRVLTWSLAAGAALYGASPQAARAEAAPQDDAALQEIVVTAERRTEKAQDVPVAITAVSAADLEARGVRQASDITATVPNMLLNLPYGPEAQPTFTLRGVTTQDFSQNQSSPIAMYVDEVYKPVGAVQALQTYDLERVEVLRGPQGTLYGKNATGGAVNFYSRNPSLSEYDGYVTVGAGNYNDYSTRAAVGGPIVDGQLGWRVAVYYENRDGWVHSVAPDYIPGDHVEPLNGIDALAARFTLLARPGDALTATLKVAVTRSGGTPYGAHAIANDPTVTGFNGTINWFDNGAKYAAHKDIRNDSASLKLDWELSPHASLTSVSGFDFGRWYEKSDDGGLPITGPSIGFGRLDDPNTYSSTVNAFSQEIRIASRDTGAFSWLAGLYYGRESTHANVQFHFFDGEGPFWAPTNAGAPAQLFGFDEYNNFDQLKDSRAAFANLTFAVAPTVTLRGGLRYTKDKVTIDNFYALLGGLASPPVGASPDVDAATWWSQSIGGPAPAGFAPFTSFQQGLAPQALGVVPELGKDTSNVSGKIGADWKPREGVLAYGSISQGYRGVAFNGQAFGDPSQVTFADPEKLTSYELGLKTELGNRRGIFNATLFHYDYKNQQFLDAFPLPDGVGTGFRTVNAPKARIDGAEFELRGKVTPDLEIGSSLGLMHSKYVDLTLNQGLCVAGTAPNCTVPRVCCVGNQLIQAPDYDASVDLDWRFARLAVGELRLFADVNFYGKQYFDAFNTERDAQGAYGVANARLSLESTGKRGYSIGAWIKNLTNRQYLAYALNQKDADTGAIGFDYALVGEPRTYGIDATLRF
ncbi:MAG TPA: TonB-dependent receptor [Steroidobacteraceae bacterium]|nr:TonB-dependent receptor [Steroidobacteraceae bacterium]